MVEWCALTDTTTLACGRWVVFHNSSQAWACSVLGRSGICCWVVQKGHQYLVAVDPWEFGEADRISWTEMSSRPTLEEAQTTALVLLKLKGANVD